ncbi:uncharacterized protein KY384_005984 [Bacidia gigantensis]|uniref:uncharacterized protein n=1 Tax=Bacidia gigantensis TaxID=2732470 RepID=UPI001D044270|nr:uncharacterized protein KY384_005984 [Bacidia gigantensis]KAG8529348.1 hypothetical protein KY384_005984 [Bacidia gigantensis]
MIPVSKIIEHTGNIIEVQVKKYAWKPTMGQYYIPPETYQDGGDQLSILHNLKEGVKVGLPEWDDILSTLRAIHGPNQIGIFEPAITNSARKPMLQFTPLLGAQSGLPGSQSLLELDGGVKILIDVGWNDSFDLADLREIERLAPTVSIILLTHATPSHLAAFAHCCKHFPSFTQIPIYATTPVISLGRTLIDDIYSSNPLACTIVPQNDNIGDSTSSRAPQILLPPPTSEEIASYFGLIHPLKFSQPHQPLPSPFSPPLNDLTITAYNAGHSLGGTIWHIQHGMESIVYAVDWNQAKENVFSGAAWLRGSGGAEVIEQLRKPTALICSAAGAGKTAVTGGRVKRDSIMLELVRDTIGRRGTILIPTDTSARVLELAYMLEHAWRKEASDPNSESPFRACKLYLASRNVGATMRYARSMLEWMEDSIVREFESESADSGSKQHKRGDSKHGPNLQQRSNKPLGPFEFQHLKILSTRKQVEKVIARQGPKVILASDTSMEWGFSRHILEKIAGNSLNTIVLTEDHSSAVVDASNQSSILGSLWQWYRHGKSSGVVSLNPDSAGMEQVLAGDRQLSFKDAQKLALESEELDIYQQYLAKQRQASDFAEMSKGMNLETSADAVEEASSSSSSDEESDPEKQGKALNTTFKSARYNKTKIEPDKEALGVNVLLRYPGIYDYDVRGKKGKDQVFPFVNKRRRGDDFGELIKPEDYLRAEERDELDAHNVVDEGKHGQERLGQKRKWQDSGHGDDVRRQGANGSNKRRHHEHTQSVGQLSHEISSNTVNGAAGDDESSTASEAESEDPPNGPARLEVKQRSVDFRLNIAYVDFAGIHDQRSLSMLIPLIHPKKLILVRGDASETSNLAQECREKLGGRSISDSNGSSDLIFTPCVGQKVDASVDTNAWTVKLSETLSRQLNWQNVKGLGIVTLAGQLAATPLENSNPLEATSRKRLKAENQSSEDEKPAHSTISTETSQFDTVPTLDVFASNIIADTRSVAQPLHVGDLRLADLRKFLQAGGHTADFRGEGTLLIDGLIAVKKSGTGKIAVEGGGLYLPEIKARILEGSFYAVKRQIYDELAVIAGE